MMKAVHLSAATEPERPVRAANKWEVLRELTVARAAFELSDRDLAVLQALISFVPGTEIAGTGVIVHPSNRSICDRLGGMPCSTMRRHLARLVDSGLVVRRDSPNGKRYARRYGDEKVAFGLDLSVLAVRFGDICAAAEEARAANERLKRLRETVSLMRRDLAGLADYGVSLRPDLEIWDAFSDLAILTARDLRRKLGRDELHALKVRLSAALEQARDLIERPSARDMSTSDADIEHHHQNSKADSHDPEPARKAGLNGDAPPDMAGGETATDDPGPVLPLRLVLSACPEVQGYSERPVRHWHDLVRLACIIRPMLGVSPDAWTAARRAMGPENASVVLAAMLERLGDIRSPGGYLRSLTQKAEAGAFSPGPMVMALLRRDPVQSSQL